MSRLHLKLVALRPISCHVPCPPSRYQQISRHAAMLEAALDAIVTMDGEGRIVDFNAAAERTFGWGREEARGRVLSELIIPPAPAGASRARPWRATWPRARRPCWAGASSCRRCAATAPRSRSSSPSAAPTWTGEPLFVGYLRDLTGARAQQAALEEAEARFRQLVEQVPTVTYICDAGEALAVRYISPQIEQWTGYAPEVWTSDPDFYGRVIHPDDHDWVVAELERCTRDEVEVDLEYRLIASDGSVLQVWDKENIVRDSRGKVLFSQGVLIDVTELRSTKAALQMSEYQLRTVVDSAPVVLFALDADGVFTLSEGRGLAALGLEPGEVVGRSVRDVYGKLPAVERRPPARAGRRDGHPCRRDRRPRLRGRVLDPARASTRSPASPPTSRPVTTASAQLAHAASHDNLTGLLNRDGLAERLHAAVEAARRGGPRDRAAQPRRGRLQVDQRRARPRAPATSCSARSPSACGRASTAPTRSPATAATSSCSLLDGAPGDGRALSPRRSPTSCSTSSESRSASAARELQLGRERRHQPVPRRRRRRRRTCSSTPTRRCTRPSAPSRGRHALYDADRRRRAPPPGARPRACARRSSRDELELHYQPVFDVATGAPVARRGADPLERPGARHGLAGRVHPARRGHRPDRADRRLGAQRGVPPGARVAGPRARARASATTPRRSELGQARLRPPRRRAHGRARRPPRDARRRDHRVGAGGPRRGGAGARARSAALGVHISIDDFGAGFSSLTRLRHLTVHTLKLDRAFLAGRAGRRARRRLHHRHARARRATSASHVVAEGIETEEQLALPALGGRAASARATTSRGRCRPPRSLALASGRGGRVELLQPPRHVAVAREHEQQERGPAHGDARDRQPAGLARGDQDRVDPRRGTRTAPTRRASPRRTSAAPAGRPATPAARGRPRR